MCLKTCLEQLTQSKSKTRITRSVHCKFNCITVKYNGTWHGIYIYLLQYNYNSLLMGIETFSYDAKQVQLIKYLIS